jgi:hypothetical protein
VKLYDENFDALNFNGFPFILFIVLLNHSRFESVFSSTGVEEEEARTEAEIEQRAHQTKKVLIFLQLPKFSNWAVRRPHEMCCYGCCCCVGEVSFFERRRGDLKIEDC